MIETSGVIERARNGFYLVTLEQPEGHQCLCRAAGKLTKFRIKLLAGDKVLVEISPYDLSRGRITYRERNAGGANLQLIKITLREIINKNNLDNIFYRFFKLTSLLTPCHCFLIIFFKS